MKTPKVVRSQAIVDLLTQFPGEEECPLSEEISGEVVVVELPRKKWTMKFDGSTTPALNGIGIVLSYEDKGTIPFSFKLEFPFPNNAAKYEAYLTGLAIAFSIGIKHMRVLGDFALREPSLASYHA